ncbi:MAG: Co2+/Mg2+ efflux protein ApaG [Betaproteobacteria bacterium]
MGGKYEFTVRAEPRFVPEQSDAGAGRYVFAYTITVANTGQTTAQLLARHWIITDADGEVEEVRGEGVGGEQPVLRPGEAFQYTSGCPLPTPVGTMRGTYFCIAEDGTRFEVPIPEFVLSAPRVLH